MDAAHQGYQDLRARNVRSPPWRGFCTPAARAGTRVGKPREPRGQHKDQKKAPRRRRISDQHHQNHPGSLACPALGALASPHTGGEVVLVAALTQGRGIVARRPGAGASAT